MQPLLHPLDAPAAAAVQHLAAVIQEGAQAVLQPHHARRARGVQHVHVDGEADLQVRQLEQALHQHFGRDGAALGLQDQADVLGRLVAHVRQQRRLLLLDQVGQRLDQLGLLHLVRHFRDDDAPHPAAQVLRLPASAQTHPAAAGLIGVENRGLTFDRHTAGRKVRTRHDLGQLGRGGGRVGQQQLASLDKLTGVVRRNRRRHPHRDARRPVRQQVGEAGRKDDRLLVLVVVGRFEVDGVLVDPLEQQLRGRRQLALGVAHRRGRIAVDVAEVSLAVDQRIALSEILRQTHQGLIDRGVAVGVVSAHDLADHLGAFARRRLRVQPHLVHGVENAAVHRLEAVTHVRQSPVGDGRQRIGQVAAAQRLLHRLVDDAAAFRRRCVDRHGSANRGLNPRSLV